MGLLFPWVEEQQVALASQRASYEKKGEDYALTHFLHLLVAFRSILLQDAACLYLL
jgi:hypothetical protein